MTTKQAFADLPVSEIMTREVQTLRAGDSIREAVGMMVENRLTTVPVVDVTNTCIGILSRSDLTELFMQEDNELTRVMDQGPSMEWLYRSLDTSDARLVQEFMIPDVATVTESDSLAATCKIMVQHEVHHIPVVDHDRRVLGIVSTFDIVRAIADPS